MVWAYNMFATKQGTFVEYPGMFPHPPAACQGEADAVIPSSSSAKYRIGEFRGKMVSCLMLLLDLDFDEI